MKENQDKSVTNKEKFTSSPLDIVEDMLMIYVNQI